MKNLCEGGDTGKMSGEEWHHPAFISVSGRAHDSYLPPLCAQHGGSYPYPPLGLGIGRSNSQSETWVPIE